MQNDQTTTEPSSAAEAGRLQNVKVEPNAEPREFRDIAIEAPKPPWRLTIDPAIEYDGEVFHTLVFDYDKLIAKDFVRAELTFNRLYKPDKNETAVLPEMHHEYQIILAAQVANVPIGVIYKLPRRYYIPVRLEALKACGSSPEEDKA